MANKPKVPFASIFIYLLCSLVVAIFSVLTNHSLLEVVLVSGGWVVGYGSNTIEREFIELHSRRLKVNQYVKNLREE